MWDLQTIKQMNDLEHAGWKKQQAEESLVGYTKKFLKTLEDVEADECVSLNLGIHEGRISDAFTKLITEALTVPMLKGITHRAIEKKQAD